MCELNTPSNGVARSIEFTHHDSLVGTPAATTRNRGMNNDGESITVSRVHRMVCNSHGILDIKMVILQDRTEQKLGWHFDLRSTIALTQS